MGWKWPPQSLDPYRIIGILPVHPPEGGGDPIQLGCIEYLLLVSSYETAYRNLVSGDILFETRTGLHVVRNLRPRSRTSPYLSDHYTHSPKGHLSLGQKSNQVVIYPLRER